MVRLSGLSALLIMYVLSVVGCGETYQVEPLLLEPSNVARTIVANQDDADRVAVAEAVVARFVKHLQSGACEEAWRMLTPGYQERFGRVAAGENARKLFCDGYKIDGEMLVKGDWVTFLLGTRAFYLTSVPPELGYENQSGTALYYVVQKDGTYRSLLMQGVADQARLEPF